MKHTPRFFNRLMLFLYGIVGLAIGAGLITITVWETAATWWNTHAQIALDKYSQATNVTRTIFAPSISWLTIAWAALALLIIILMLAWIFHQGGGSTRRIKTEESVTTKGLTVASLKFAEAVVIDTIGDNRWIASIKASGWKVKGQNALALKVVTQKGACPKHLKEVLDQAIKRLDATLGKEVPVYIHLTTGWKTTFGSPGRVDN